MGLVAPTLVGVALTGVPEQDAGSASGAVTTSGQLGGAIGVAAVGAVFFGALSRHGGAAAAYPAAFDDALGYEIGAFLLAALLMRFLPAAPAPPEGASAP
jgi:hypothetical protein